MSRPASLGKIDVGSPKQPAKTTRTKRRISKRTIALSAVALVFVVGVGIVYADGIFPGTQTTTTKVIGSSTATSTATAFSTATVEAVQTDQNTTVVQPVILLSTTTVTTTLADGTTTITTTVYTTNTTITNAVETISCPQAPLC